MKFEEILRSSNNILTNTYSLYVECNKSYKAELKLKQCWKLLTELCDIMESFICHLFKDFRGFNSIHYMALAQGAEFIWKESSMLRKRVKR